MAYVLKEFGFGTKIHARNQFGVDEFKRLFQHISESGIPLIVAIDNRSEGGRVGHAILSIGHEKTTDELIERLDVLKNTK
jgi:hypothetical protein